MSLHHLKQPAAEVGPFKIHHDHDSGHSTIWRAIDLVELVRATGGISVIDVARALFDSPKPTDAQKEEARRRLDALVKTGHLWVFDPGDPRSNRPKIWAS